jgi:hypothetical protein
MPNTGMAIISDAVMKSKKHTRTTNADNISCCKGFVSRKTVKAILKSFMPDIIL